MSENEAGQVDRASSTTSKPEVTEAPWERAALMRLAETGLKEQRSARRWNVFFKCLFFAYLIGIAVLYTPSLWPDSSSSEPHTALVELKGTIASGSDASADRMAQGLRAAFEDENTKAVILRINSPGGSPVQSAYINNEITRLRKLHPDTPLYAVIADVCASGGYYVAAAADKIYANESSLVGSIGVLTNGFGFTELMEKVGVERRLITAGERKGFLDPFTPQKPEDIEHLGAILGELHAEFIDVVKRGRGDRLKGGDELFSGLVWSGRKAKSLGLVDEFASAGEVARDVVGIKEIVDFTPRPSLLEKLAKRVGVSIGTALAVEVGLTPLSVR
jgi:protease IV